MRRTQTTEDKIIGIAKKINGDRTIDQSTRLSTCFDELAKLEFCMEVESMFKISITDEELDEMHVIKDMTDHVESKMPHQKTG